MKWVESGAPNFCGRHDKRKQLQGATKCLTKHCEVVLRVKLSVFHIDGGFKTADFHESSEYGTVRTS